MTITQAKPSNLSQSETVLSTADLLKLLDEESQALVAQAEQFTAAIQSFERHFEQFRRYDQQLASFHQQQTFLTEELRRLTEAATEYEAQGKTGALDACNRVYQFVLSEYEQINKLPVQEVRVTARNRLKNLADLRTTLEGFLNESLRGKSMTPEHPHPPSPSATSDSEQ